MTSPADKSRGGGGAAPAVGGSRPRPDALYWLPDFCDHPRDWATLARWTAFFRGADPTNRPLTPPRDGELFRAYRRPPNVARARFELLRWTALRGLHPAEARDAGWRAALPLIVDIQEIANADQ